MHKIVYLLFLCLCSCMTISMKEDSRSNLQSKNLCATLGRIEIFSPKPFSDDQYLEKELSDQPINKSLIADELQKAGADVECGVREQKIYDLQVKETRTSPLGLLPTIWRLSSLATVGVIPYWEETIQSTTVTDQSGNVVGQAQVPLKKWISFFLFPVSISDSVLMRSRRREVYINSAVGIIDQRKVGQSVESPL